MFYEKIKQILITKYKVPEIRIFRIEVDSESAMGIYNSSHTSATYSIIPTDEKNIEIFADRLAFIAEKEEK